MKKISALLLIAAITFSACHNEGSSSIGVYDSDEPAHAAEHKEGHEDKVKKEHPDESPDKTIEHTDTAHMPKDEIIKDSAQHH